MRLPNESGLGDAEDPSYRSTIVAIDQSGDMERAILEIWGRATAEEARERLGRDDVQVTNKSDKAMQLPLLGTLNAMARAIMLSGARMSLEYSQSLVLRPSALDA